jgi:hypothetical protein
VLNTRNEFEGFDPIIWVFDSRVSSAVENLVLDDEMRDLVIGVAATPRQNLGGPRYQCNFQLLATWIPRFADTDRDIMKRIKRWIAQGNAKFIPTMEAFHRAMNWEGRPGATAAEKVALLALDYCRMYAIYVSEEAPGELIRHEFRRCGKQLLHVRLSDFGESDLQRLRAPIFDARIGIST